MAYCREERKLFNESIEQKTLLKFDIIYVNNLLYKRTIFQFNVFMIRK